MTVISVLDPPLQVLQEFRLESPACRILKQNVTCPVCEHPHRDNMIFSAVSSAPDLIWQVADIYSEVAN